MKSIEQAMEFSWFIHDKKTEWNAVARDNYGLSDFG
jgi:hypothetical protein